MFGYRACTKGNSFRHALCLLLSIVDKFQTCIFNVQFSTRDLGRCRLQSNQIIREILKALIPIPFANKRGHNGQENYEDNGNSKGAGHIVFLYLYKNKLRLNQNNHGASNYETSHAYVG